MKYSITTVVVFLWLCASIFMICWQQPVDGALIETERIAEYHARNHTWPIPTYVPETPGWRALMESRFRQIEQIESRGPRYEGYLQSMSQALTQPNFTEYGFGLAKCPDDLLQALQQGIHDGLPTARHENVIEVIDAPEQPLFIDRPDLTERVLQELKYYAQEWSGHNLVPFRAYGFRLYQNHSQLTMHVDKSQTHVISFILHIDSSEDAEPWPIFIESFDGSTHEVTLTPGDMLFYESSKCMHGRPRRLNGSWYSSLFVHYYPKDNWSERDFKMEGHYAIPPSWSESVQNHDEPKLEMVGTSFKEPECVDDWCRAADSVKWSGPAEPNVWIAPDFKRHPFNPDRHIPVGDAEL